MTLLLGLTSLPWIAKFFLAITSDGISCCGSRRKSYLIINSSVAIFSIILLMLFGLANGKYFIMFCIMLSQLCMTWNDAITDALMAQAARLDLKHGASHLNTLATYMYAFGGIIGCMSAGFIELEDGNDLDPNVYFGTYAGLIFIVLISSVFLSQQMEPEIILIKRLKK